ncbi:uncharacterized protein LOC112513323 isoform X2 [Cynara cardunculus var. scolymus]|uniref:uncharacterized protein LOC112513323 isoform X2 n=1 Tax=Cynara cardunculus var. scolymus TaxID=59895 RepID=UPI000D62D7B9|nr:uncharacterized protein LOC112513323 isoform X2 [Cynara cardunculus var. scolymus]
MDSVLEFLYPKLILFVLGFWSSVSTYLLQLLRYFTRFIRNGSSSSKGVLNDSRVGLMEAIEGSSKVTESEMEFEENPCFFSEFLSMENDGVEEDETPEFSFTFKFPTFEEFSKTQKDFSHLLDLENSFSEFINPLEVSHDLDEVESNSNNGFFLDDDQKKDDFEDQEEEEEGVHEASHDLDEVESNSNNGFLLDEQKGDDFEAQEEGDGVHEQMMVETPNENKIGEGTEEIDTFIVEKLQKVHHESFQSSSDSDTDSVSSNNLHLDDGFLSDGDFELESIKKDQDECPKPDFLSEKDFGGKSRNIMEPEVSNVVDTDKKNLSNDTTNKLESLWEHQELIEQLKMEIKKVRATGLPTILEEPGSPPKIMEELKPWKIEEVYQSGGGTMGEVHKFYKSYRERMRKFDIFNYQKMYAIGFLQLKDPLQSASSSKSSVSEITTLLSQSFATPKGKKHENDPTVKFIKELQSDLEVVYVGQMCLSWEILHWQYEKALDIWESDPRGVRRFNDIAGEFQQFQVLMQRFIEDEPFQDPRIQNYVKNRCIFRNLLQVPVIREDPFKSKKKARSEFVYDITSDMLIEILEESIRIFWRFVRADKYRRQTPVEFQKPEDSQIFMDLQKDLHKKEKKLKEQMRSGKCILKKMKRRCREEEEEEIEDEVVYFFCQVDMKLVSRVLQMSRLTSDQLMWCHNKLSKLSFANRKIHVEPSFLLFPC